MIILKCDNYVEVEKDSAENALAILKSNLKSNPCGPDQKKVTFDHLNYYQYDTRPSNSSQVDGSRNSRRPWNNRNCNSDSTPNRGDNSTNKSKEHLDWLGKSGSVYVVIQFIKGLNISCILPLYQYHYGFYQCWRFP